MKKKNTKKRAVQRRKTSTSAKEKREMPKQKTSLPWEWLSTVAGYPFYLSCIMLVTSLGMSAQTLRRSVVGSGATTLIEQSYIHRATLGQTAIGRISTPSQDTHHVGFWYTANAIIRRAGGAIVSLPVMEVHLGETVDVPLSLTVSANIANKKQNFIARIRYNNSLLMPLDASLPLAFDGNDAIITVSGKVSQLSEIVSTLRFKVMMGNAPRTPLTIEAFSIGNGNTSTIIKKNGEVIIKDLCEAGDTTRLFKRVLAASLLSIRPNPVATTAEIDFTLSETGISKLSLSDLSGKEVATIWEGQASKGYYTKSFAVGTLSNGEYFLRLQTPNELFVLKLIIQR